MFYCTWIVSPSPFTVNVIPNLSNDVISKLQNVCDEHVLKFEDYKSPYKGRTSVDKRSNQQMRTQKRE